MPKIYDKIQSAATPLDKFLGADARIVEGRDIMVSNHVKAQMLEVSFDGDNLPDEQGRLFLFPIDDGKFSLQLCYLIHSADTERNNTVYSIVYLPAFFEQYPSEILIANKLFSQQKASEQQFFICARAANLLESFGGKSSFTPLTGLLHTSQTAINLLERALEIIAVPFTVCQVPACRFLAYDTEREKIQDAITFIENQSGKPHTIKELARKVAMNECYLKKGFKAITGKTIHEYQQELRINKAKELLKKDGYSVTAAAFELGYSSIAHFSTAFKRVTGLKPCDLIS